MSTAVSEMATDRWRLVRLGDAIELAYGKNLPKPQRREGSIPVYGSNGVAGWHDEAFVENSTVIVGRKGSAGAVHLVEGPCFPIDTTYYTRPRAGFEFDVRFLAYALRSLNLERLRTSTGVPGLSREDAYREFLPVPTLPEQRHIADVLSRAENIVRMRREAEQKAKEIIPALFLDMFGDPATNPKAWEVKRIDELTTVGTGGTPSRDKPKYYGGDIPWVKTGEVSGSVVTSTEEFITDLAIEETNCKKFPIGTILIAMYGQGQTRGRAAILGVEAATNQACAAILPSDKVETSFLYRLLVFQYDVLRAMGRGGNQANLNLSMIKTFRVPMPDRDLQRKFANLVASLEAVLDTSRLASIQAGLSFQSLLAGVFGE
jgi:type I restriction enzyme S subunit